MFNMFSHQRNTNKSCFEIACQPSQNGCHQECKECGGGYGETGTLIHQWDVNWCSLVGSQSGGSSKTNNRMIP